MAHWLYKVLLAVLAHLLHVSLAQESLGNLVLVPTAPRGAACLDGSPPGYWIRPASSTAPGNSTRWVLHMEGGGWCWNEDECAQRAQTSLGSSHSWGPTTQCYGSCDGILSANCTTNPDFCTWNAVFVGYCDGSSFSSMRSDVHMGLHYRGRANLDAVIDSLQHSYGLGSPGTEIIVTGGSAGGLSTYLQVDYIAERFGSGVTVRGLGDAGWFLDHTTISNQTTIRDEFVYAFQMWNSTEGVNKNCIQEKSKTNSTWMCVFAQYTFPYIQTPIFVAEGLYDSWQLNNILMLGCGNPTPQKTCNPSQLNAFYQYGEDMRSSITSSLTTVNHDRAQSLQLQPHGAFVSACIVHCQTVFNEGEDRWNTWTINGQKVREVFHSWYFSTGPSSAGIAIDSVRYPNNPSCPVYT